MRISKILFGLIGSWLLFAQLNAIIIEAPNLKRCDNSSVKGDEDWRIGGKIHFEEENGSDFLGTKHLNKVAKEILNDHIHIESDSCIDHAKILLKMENGIITMTHYEEKSKPGVGEELHATLLYTSPRGFCNSETLSQVWENLFEKTDSPPTLECVAEAYSTIIKPNWKFQIAEIILSKSSTGSSFIIAKLVFNERENLYKDNKPISAGLHMALVNLSDGSILNDDAVNAQMIKEFDSELKGKSIKVASKNGVADLEFGISGSSFRIRANEL